MNDRKSCALVFATDDSFSPLAKGLVLSVQQQCASNEFTFHLIDIGCSPSTLEWMKSNGVQIHHCSLADHITLRSDLVFKKYMLAQFCRPFIPKIVPEHHVYIWCDSDIWIQDISSLRLFRDVALANSGKVPICPLVDVSYSFNYIDSCEFSRYANIWYNDAYGKTVASTYANRAVLSSGLFAMQAENPIWEAWAKEIEFILRRKFSSHASFHLCEQTAFNYLLYSRDQFVPLEAIHNYNCHIGRIIRSSNGDVVIKDSPHRRVGVIHFTYSSKMMNFYIENKLLFRGGDYLSAEEIARLRTLNHY